MAAHGMTARAAEVDRTMRHIFRRCVLCTPVAPTCPACPSGDICSLVPQSCDECAHMVCIANPNPSPPSAAARTNVGAIAGGVIGGVAFMAIACFLFWRYWIRKRRAEQDQWDEDEDDMAAQKGRSQFNAMKSDAASTRTSRSVAASFLSRASNIIHIAYIPGVTNRFGSGHSSMQAPVPPIPAAYRNGRTPGTATPKSPLSNEGDALFFRPSDLRDSTWSDGSSLRSGRRDTQYTTHSITPSLARTSIMSDVYRDDATTEPMPATQAWRAAPRMVSVKTPSAASTPSMEDPPTMGQMPGGGVKAVMPGEQSSNSPSSQHTGGTFAGKATPVTIGGGNKGKGRFPVRQSSDESTSAKTSATIRPPPANPSPLVETANESDEEQKEDDYTRARRSIIRETTAAAYSTAPLIQPLESPFFDATELQTSASSSSQSQRPNPYAAMSASVGSGPRFRNAGTDNNRGPGGLSAVIEEAARRASQDPDHEGLGAVNEQEKREESPFSDVYAAK